MSIFLKRGCRLIINYVQAKALNSIGRIGPLQRIVIAVTYRCNSKCTTCEIWKIRHDASEELNLSDYNTLGESRLLSTVDEISFTGGEPFLRDDLVEIVQDVSRNTRAIVSIASNGLLTDRILTYAKMLHDNGMRSLRIVLSLNGRPETHDRIRGIKGNFRRVMETAEGLKRTGVEISFIFTITRDNYDEILWTFELAREKEIPISFFPEVDSYRFEKTDSGNQFTSEQKEHIIAQLEEVYTKRNYYYFDDSNLLYIQRVFANEQVCKCNAGRQNIFLDPFGNVYPCEGLHDRKFSFGNIREQRLENIWKSEQASRVRRFIWENRCQPCYLACEIIPSLRKEIFPVITYALKRRLSKRKKTRQSVEN